MFGRAGLVSSALSRAKVIEYFAERGGQLG